jgi:uncharacterized protein YoxC
MMLVSLAALVVALGVVVLVAALVPAINEVRKTSIALREFIVSTESSLNPVLGELRKTLADVREMTDAAAARRDDITTLMSALGDTGESVHRLNGIIGGAVQVIEKPVMYWAGLKAATQNILGHFTRKGGN